MAVGVIVQNVLYDVDFTSLATQTLADQGASFALDGQTWYQDGQNAGNPTHSQIINTTGLVITAGSGTYKIGLKLSELDSSFTSGTFNSNYQIWVDYSRTGTANFNAYGTGFVDPTQTGPYSAYMGYANTSPTHALQTFDTGFTQHETTTSVSTGVHVVTVQNREFFEGFTGAMSSGDFPTFDTLTRIGGVDRSNLNVNVSDANLSVGFVHNNIAGVTHTIRRMRIVKAEG